MKPHVQVLLYAFLVIFVSIGLGRFSFGMILPNLQNDLQISTTLSGFIGTSNFIGYFIGIFFVSTLYKKYETSSMLFIILFLQAISMFLMAISTNYMLVSLFFAFTGFFSAIANVSIMVYITHVIPQKYRGKALGLVVTGIGLGIIFSCFYVPIIESMTSLTSWRVSWMSFALITLVIIALAVMTKKRESDFSKFDKNEEKNKDNK